ncbi:MAG: aminotransferase class V-fold PLP-dependent enzyme [Enterobacterales bacterium]|nr:aminotransferase class V-fold PLP-dependent enzyme [Enterobacterales bacterium]
MTEGLTSNLEQYFSQFRKNIVGYDLENEGTKILYADWTASGRLYRPIEDFMLNKVGPLIANTHTEASFTGSSMTHLYHQAQKTIKDHLNASNDDVLICAGAGMTAVINKFQRILGLRIPEKWASQIRLEEEDKPVVFITHMEHHSNQTTWEECAVTVVRIPENKAGLPDTQALEKLLQDYQDRPLKIGSFTACSNVTGIKIDYKELASIMHQNNGYCFIDFAASAPYVDINMHPENDLEMLDAVMFSPHKFLGGPGSSGVLVFNRQLYHNKVPDHPGGGTVTWTNPWGKHHFFNDIEVREDGGTPGFLQCIRTALSIKLKEQMGTKNIAAREKELVDILYQALEKIPGLEILHHAQKNNRLCVISFYLPNIHFNLIVRLLSDRFGIQTRGGCSCAGTYGHILLGVDEETSEQITCQIDQGDLSQKPGWVRLSMHPTSTNKEAQIIASAISDIVDNIDLWQSDYHFDATLGDYQPLNKAQAYLSLDDYR